jgi:general secretion pathway protein D
VISTSPRYMNAVLSIVDELDAAPPQVMIQVLLAEVTLDSTDTWGMDVSVGPFGGDGTKIGSTAAGVGVATALGVPNLSVSSSDFGILVRSLEEQGKLEVLSNPQVMVNNNQNAKIQVGENIAVVNGVERGFSGNSFADVIRQDVGIILNVQPSISTDGFVRMDIKPEISQLSEKTTQVSSDVTSPIITKRSVDTVVTVKDGQSVVIGGLIQTSEEKRRTKVPIIADIPIIGLPFRTKKDTSVKTELLVILTPRVIPGSSGLSEAAVKDVTEQAVDRLEDPSKVEDYLERVRQEVQRKRQLEEQQKERSDGAPASSGSSPAPAPPTSPDSPPPAKPEEHSVLIPPTSNAPVREATLVSQPRTRRP